MQVRIFGSALGIFKGVLTRKLNSTCIELPPSMCEVKMSKVPANDDVCGCVHENDWDGAAGATVPRDIAAALAKLARSFG